MVDDAVIATYGMLDRLRKLPEDVKP